MHKCIWNSLFYYSPRAERRSFLYSSLTVSGDVIFILPPKPTIQERNMGETTTFTLAARHPGIEIKTLYYCTLYNTVKHTKAQPCAEVHACDDVCQTHEHD